MSTVVSDVERRLRMLREEFDRSFAAPPAPHAEERVDLLAVRAGDLPYALRLADVGCVLVDRPIMRVPSPMPELLGVCSVRGTIAAVFDAAALLGHARAGAPRFLMQLSHGESICLAFTGFDGHVRVAAGLFASAEPPPDAGSRSTAALARATVLLNGEPRAVIDGAAVVDVIERRCSMLGSRNEEP